jgi:hypothetical protein
MFIIAHLFSLLGGFNTRSSKSEDGQSKLLAGRGTKAGAPWPLQEQGLRAREILTRNQSSTSLFPYLKSQFATARAIDCCLLSGLCALHGAVGVFAAVEFGVGEGKIIPSAGEFWFKRDGFFEVTDGGFEVVGFCGDEAE